MTCRKNQAAAPAQEQFLAVVSRDEAVARWAAVYDAKPLGQEVTPLDEALGRVLASDIAAPVDVPPFDRALLDGFAVRAEDAADASPARPVVLRLTGETIACGHAPARSVGQGEASVIATGGPLPRGADAVVMIEHTEPGPDGEVLVLRPATPGQGIGFAGSDLARGETILRVGTLLSAREIGLLAACGLAGVSVIRKPRIGVLSTGDELVAPGERLRPAAIYDTNASIIAASIAENGGEPVRYGVIVDEAGALREAMKKAHAECDMVVLSGGTSKGEGDLTYRLVGELGAPGLVVHGVSLKPGKPLGLALCDGKPVVLLPGFPTSAMFTFHDIVAPVLRRMGGLPPRGEAHLAAKLPVRIGSDLGRTEFVMVSLVEGEGGLVAYPTGKGSGAMSSFSQSDGFFAVDQLADAVNAGETVDVALFSRQMRLPDLVIVGSHCTGLDVVVSALNRMGFSVRTLAVGSLGGLAAARRGECDLAPIHLMQPETGLYNTPFLDRGLTLVPGWRRMQGIVFAHNDARFVGKSRDDLANLVRNNPELIMVSRNQGAGTRILIDGLLAGARPQGYWNQPRSHNAVAAAVAQGRADWGVTIAPVAESYGLGFVPLGPEHYDFALVESRCDRPAVQAFLAALADEAVRAAITQRGFEIAPERDAGEA